MNINIPGIDTQQAIKNSGSIEMFMELLTDVYKLIDDKSDQVEAYLNEKDISRYTVLVHSLKTTCQMIGAMDLREQFYTLEKLGKENNLEQIEKFTPDVLKVFRSLKPYLESFVPKDDSPKADFDKNEVESALKLLVTSIDDFDLNSAEEAIKKLTSYSYDSGLSDKMSSLEKQVSNLDYDEAKELAEQILLSL